MFVKKKYNQQLDIDYKKNGIAIWKVILDYETQTIFLSVSEDPVRFGPVVMKKQGLL